MSKPISSLDFIDHLIGRHGVDRWTCIKDNSVVLTSIEEGFVAKAMLNPTILVLEDKSLSLYSTKTLFLIYSFLLCVQHSRHRHNLLRQGRVPIAEKEAIHNVDSSAY
ncbi:UNVERIFIED_CONTAM: hypothetical protein NCL1_09501 [Trichonephila clavipes]